MAQNGSLFRVVFLKAAEKPGQASEKLSPGTDPVPPEVWSERPSDHKIKAEQQN